MRDPEHTTRMRGCPYCNPHNNCTDTIPKNSLRRLINKYPDIASEYLQSKNMIDLKDILITSNKNVWWKCNKCSNEWQAIVANRVNHTSGCPKCSIGNNGSFMDFALYLILKDKFSNTEYQFKVNNMSFDIGIPEIETVIEYQGRYYHSNKYNSYNVEKRDIEKRKFVESFKNIKYITINETYGGETIHTVGNDIYFNANNINKENSLKNIVIELEKILNIKIPIRDDIVTYATQRLKLKEISDSLATKYPELVKEWNFEKNGELKPTQLKPKSNKKVWWQCSKCGYEWQISPAHRTSSGTGCARCVALRGSGAGIHMVIKGVNDLKTLYPLIALDWDDENNKKIGLSLDNIAAQSNKYVWWKCRCCGCNYMDKVVYRTKRNHKCPKCNN